MATAKEICTGVPKSSLDSTVSDIHIAQLAKVMDEWQLLAPFFGLTRAEELEIVEQYRGRLQLQKREALRIWKLKNGSDATYRSLIEIFCTQERVDLAETLKGYLTSKNQIEAKVSSKNGVIDVFHAYLCDCYSHLPHPSTSQWPFLSSVTCKYVELDLYDVPPKGDLADTPSYHKQITLKYLFSAGNFKAKRKVILVEGVAGVGKTTLSWHACKEWAAGRLFNDIKLLIHVSLSDPELHSPSKLADLIPHHSEEMRKSVADAIAENGGKKVCFLLEGCDEAPQSAWEAFLNRFIAGRGGRAMVHNAHLILTSRPGISVQLAGFLTGRILIRGFQSLDTFFAKCSVDNKEQLVEAVKMKPELHSLCHLPLNAMILVYLYDVLKDNLPTTRTGLFDPLVRNFLFRHMKERTSHKVSSIRNLPEGLPTDIRQSLTKVSELAYKSILGQKKVVDEQTLTGFGLSEIDNALGFLRVHLRLTMYGASECYSFMHLSLQEYLAAFYISQMNERGQAAAIKKVFDQNPLSPVLTFYAGLTRLTVKQVRDVFFKVLEHPLDVASVVKQLGLNHPNTFFRANPADDVRRKVLALINCIYEAQNLCLIPYIQLPLRDIGGVDITESSCKGKGSEGVTRQKNRYVTLRGFLLYPTDCLSIGYFARHVGQQTNHRLDLELDFCPLGDMEIKALTQELKKPADKENVSLTLRKVHLSVDALASLSTVFTPYSCLVGLSISGEMLDDIQLATQYLIEGFNRSRCKDLELYPCSYRAIYHLVLLFKCPNLNSCNLYSSRDLFVSSTIVRLFSESLKFTHMSYLCLAECGIDDDALMLLAPGVSYRHCTLVELDIDKNLYSDDALKDFLQYYFRSMFDSEPHPGQLCSLSVTHISDIHRNLVEEINSFRSCQFSRPSRALTIMCISELIKNNKVLQAELKGVALLQLRSDLCHRSPHHS